MDSKTAVMLINQMLDDHSLKLNGYERAALAKAKKVLIERIDEDEKEWSEEHEV